MFYTEKIVANKTIQTAKGKGSSPLEFQGFIKCLDDLKPDSYPVHIFTLSPVTSQRSLIFRLVEIRLYKLSIQSLEKNK